MKSWTKLARPGRLTIINTFVIWGANVKNARHLKKNNSANIYAPFLCSSFFVQFSEFMFWRLIYWFFFTLKHGDSEWEGGWTCYISSLWTHCRIIVVINAVPRNFFFENGKLMHHTNPHLLLIVFEKNGSRGQGSQGVPWGPNESLGVPRSPKGF